MGASISKLDTSALLNSLVPQKVPETKFGTHVFKGVAAQPYLEKYGLDASVLDTPDWIKNSNLDKVRFLFTYSLLYHPIDFNYDISYVVFFRRSLLRSSTGPALMAPLSTATGSSRWAQRACVMARVHRCSRASASSTNTATWSGTSRASCC